VNVDRGENTWDFGREPAPHYDTPPQVDPTKETQAEQA
jgi:hypothetical protein